MKLPNDGLTYIPTKHKYYLDGVELPSVSAVLGGCGIITSRFYKPEHAERGHRVHAACLKMTYTGKATPTDLRSQVKQWAAFCKQFQFEVMEAERPRYHKRLKYAGTPDYVGSVVMRGRRIPAIIDIKSGAPCAWHDIQITAYAELLKNPKSWEKLIVYLNRNTINVVPRIKVSDRAKHLTYFGVFLSALNVWYWKFCNRT
jgi:hypothetical protein